MKRLLVLSALAICFCSNAALFAQSLGNAGTIAGTVLDPSGAAVPNADVSLHNVVSGYTQSTKSGPDGAFRLGNIPPNPYHLEVKAPGFAVYSQDVDIKGSITVPVKANLMLAGANTSVTVEGTREALETDPSAHVDIDRSLLMKLPALDPAGSLSQAIIYS